MRGHPTKTLTLTLTKSSSPKAGRSHHTKKKRWGVRLLGKAEKMSTSEIRRRLVGLVNKGATKLAMREKEKHFLSSNNITQTLQLPELS